MSGLAGAAAATAVAAAVGLGLGRGSPRRRLLRRRLPQRTAPRPVGRSSRPLLAGAAVVAALVLGMPPWEPALGLAAWVALRLTVRRHRARRRRRAHDADVVTLTFAVAGELRAGQTPADALAAAAPHLRELGGEIAVAARAVNRGAALADELAVVDAASPSDRLRPVTAAWVAASAAGARVADVLERLGTAFDADDAAADEVQAAAAGPRATIVVLAALPLLGIAMGTAVGLSPLHVLLHTGAGAVLAAGAVGLDAVGLLWVRRITRGALRS